MGQSRKTNRDHAKKMTRPMVEESTLASQLEGLLTPAIVSQENYYRQLGLRARILNLPLMVAAVLTLLWRDVAGVTELTRMLAVRRFFVVPTHKGHSTSNVSKIFKFSSSII